MNVICHVDRAVVLLGGGGDMSTLHAVIKLVWTFCTQMWWGPKNLVFTHPHWRHSNLIHVVIEIVWKSIPLSLHSISHSFTLMFFTTFTLSPFCPFTLLVLCSFTLVPKKSKNSVDSGESYHLQFTLQRDNIYIYIITVVRAQECNGIMMKLCKGGRKKGYKGTTVKEHKDKRVKGHEGGKMRGHKGRRVKWYKGERYEGGRV